LRPFSWESLAIPSHKSYNKHEADDPRKSGRRGCSVDRLLREHGPIYLRVQRAWPMVGH